MFPITWEERAKRIGSIRPMRLALRIDECPPWQPSWAVVLRTPDLAVQASVSSVSPSHCHHQRLSAWPFAATSPQIRINYGTRIMSIAIQCRNLRKTYDGKVEAVAGLDLEIE